MRDYSKYEKTPVLFSGAEKKFEIIIDGFRYIVKFQKNSEVGLTFNYVSEYLGSHIFQLLGIPVQETFLGTYEGKNVVVMKNFLGPEDDLVAFNGVGESSLERDKELYQYTYEDITAMLRENMKSTNVEETIDRFWDMFIVDALIGNFDRHGGNWGFIKKDNQYRIAPGYIDVVIIVSALYDIPAVRLAGVCRSRHINDRDVQAVHQILERSGIACADRLSVHKSAVECLILRRIFHIINLPDTFFKDSLDLPIVIHRTVDIT